jgi:hypothetical protein
MMALKKVVIPGLRRAGREAPREASLEGRMASIQPLTTIPAQPPSGTRRRRRKMAGCTHPTLLKKPAGKDGRTDMAATLCRTETMTGQPIAIGSGRHLH